MVYGNKFFESRENTNYEIKGRIEKKLQEIMEQIEEKEKAKSKEEPVDRNNMFANLLSGVQDEKSATEYYINKEPAKETKELDANCIE